MVVSACPTPRSHTLPSPIRRCCSSGHPSLLSDPETCPISTIPSIKLSITNQAQNQIASRRDFLRGFALISSPLIEPFDTPSLLAEQVKDFDYIKASGKGPEQWGDLRPEWATCKSGDMQSPIDLVKERVLLVPNLGELKTKYRPSNAALRNRGHGLEIQWVGNAGSIEIYGVEFVLQQSHWHFPSEHTIDGRRFDLELHMVHKSSDGKTAVVGVFYNIGAPDTVLSGLMTSITPITDPTQKEVNVGIVDPNQLNTGGEYYSYLGSLTTPPCTEEVIWTINKRVKTVSMEQLRLLSTAVQNEPNARPVQELNHREILLYSTGRRSL